MVSTHIRGVRIFTDVSCLDAGLYCRPSTLDSPDVVPFLIPGPFLLTVCQVYSHTVLYTKCTRWSTLVHRERKCLLPSPVPFRVHRKGVGYVLDLFALTLGLH